MNKLNFTIAEMQKCEEMYNEFIKDTITFSNPIEELTRKIREKEDNAAAMEFTRVICELLKENGVSVVARKYIYDRQFNKTFDILSENYGASIEGLDFLQHDKEFADEIKKLQFEVEKYRKAFESVKKERDYQIAEYKKKINELEQHHKFSMMQIDDVLVGFLGVTHEIMDKPSDFEKVLQEAIEKSKTVTDLLPTEPIKVADMLINAEGEYEHNSLVKKICGTDKGTYRIFGVSELRQIAEHLLIYCNHYREEEE